MIRLNSISHRLIHNINKNQFNTILKRNYLQSRPNYNQYYRANPEQGGFKWGAALFVGTSASIAVVGSAWWAQKRHEERLHIVQQWKDAHTNVKSSLQKQLENMFSSISNRGKPEIPQGELERKLDVLKDKLDHLSTTEKVVWGIIGLNSIVFLAWQIPNIRVQRFMDRHFIHHYLSKRYYTMLTSSFSHNQLFHFLFNMMALKSFGQVAGHLLGPEQFLALYLTGAVVSSAPRHLLTGWLLKPGPVNRSLGASGALFCIVGLVAYLRPDISASIIFLPWFPLQLNQMLAGFMALDLVGLIRGWQTFDHMSHLAGAILGLLYGKFGFEHVWYPVNEEVKKVRQWIKDQERSN